MSIAFFSTNRCVTGVQRFLAGVVVALLVLSGVASTVPAPVAAQQTVQIPYGNVIVVLQDGLDPSAFASTSGVQPSFVYRTLLTGFAANLTEAAARRLAQVPQVKGIYPDYPVSPAAQIIPTGVERVNAPRNPIMPFGNGGGATVGGMVAVVDSGVAPLGDLNLIDGYNCTSSNIEDFGDGFGHGTHVAGILGAKDNDVGVVGVAPGVGIFSARMLDADGGGTQSGLICALEAVSWHPEIRAANLSLTTNDANPGVCGVNASALHQTVCTLVGRGTAVVVAAGNYGQPVVGTMAAYPEVIAVSAFQDFDGKPGGLAPKLCSSGDIDDTFWISSNRGPEVAIMAPGVCIRSYAPDGSQVYRSGTSMAAPHVTGALALYFSAWGGDSVAAARAWLLGSAAVSQAAAGVSGAPYGEPVLMLGPEPGITPTPGPTHPATGTVTVTPTPPNGLGPGVVGQTTAALNLRAKPSTGSPVITVLPKNTQVLVTGYPQSSGGYLFLPVTTSYGRGWVVVNWVTAIGTATPTSTPTSTPTNTSTSTPTVTRTPTATSTTIATNTNTATPTVTMTPTETETPPATPTDTHTVTATATSTSSPSPTQTHTATVTSTATSSPIPTNTPTATATSTATPTSTNTATVTPSPTPTNTNTATATSTPTNTKTVTVTPTPSLTPTNTNTATATSTSSSTPTETNTATATSTRTPLPTNTATKTATPSATSAPTFTPTAPSGLGPGVIGRVTSGLNLRAAPSTSSQVIRVLPTNTLVTVTGYSVVSGSWIFIPVSTPYGSGWVVTNWVVPVGTATPTPVPTLTRTATIAGPTATASRTPIQTITATATTSGGFGIGTTVRTTTRLNMRSGPGTGFGVLVVLPSNTTGTVIGGPTVVGSADWYQVDMGSLGSGWVSGGYLVATGGPAPTVVPTATPTTPAGIVIGSSVRTTTSVNMRSGPGTNNNVVTVLPGNVMGSVLAGPSYGSGYQWFKVNMPGFGIGWVASDYLALIGTPAPTPSAASGWPSGSHVRTTDRVNMRNGAGTGNSVIAVLPSGADCTVLSGPTQANGYHWYRLNCSPRGIGYVAGEYLQQVSASAATVATATVESVATSEPMTETPAAQETPLPEIEPSVIVPDVLVTTAPESETPVELATPLPPIDPEITVLTPSSVPTDIPTATVVLGEVVSSPDAGTPVEILIPTEIPIAEITPLPIVRVQRSEGSSPAQVLVDDDPATVWMTDGSAVVPVAAFVVDLDTVQSVGSISFASGADGIAGTLHLSISADNENWTDLSIDALAPAGEWQELAVGMDARYIRFVFVNDDALEAVGGIAEIRIWP